MHLQFCNELSERYTLTAHVEKSYWPSCGENNYFCFNIATTTKTPHLVYHVKLWSPYPKLDKFASEMLNRLGLFSLEFRRGKIEIYKMLR